ncbi:MAG: hypothetical protein K6B52_08940 [Clostridiales bacterium]|nr:hypothetical protein [Clostridiales bacterium]
MKKIINIVVSVILAVSVTGFHAYAAGGKVIYSGNCGKYFFRPGSAYSLTDLFPDFKGVMPGDSLTQDITVFNRADNRVKVKIFMRSLGAVDEMSKKFLSQLHMTVTKLSDTKLFDATADEKDGLEEWTLLGTLYSGGKVDLRVTLDVPVTLDNEFQKWVGLLDWEFKVEELEIEKTDPKPPYTGSGNILTFWLPVCSMFAGSVAVFVILVKKNKEKAVNGSV